MREAFLNRPGLVEAIPGFLGLETFTDNQDASLFYLLTRWTDGESFRRWHSGPDHQQSHKGIPKGLKLDPSFTEVRVLGRLPVAATFMRSDVARDSASLISNFLDRSTTVVWVRVRSDGIIVSCNPAFAKMLGRDSLEGASIWLLLTDPDADNLRHLIQEYAGAPFQECALNFVDREGVRFTLHCNIHVQPEWFALIGEPVREDEARLQCELMGLNNRLAVELRENDRNSKALRLANARLEQALIELCESQRHLSNIREVIPLCMRCGRVKTGDSKWEAVLEYFQRNNLAVSHGLCPECYQKESDQLER